MFPIVSLPIGFGKLSCLVSCNVHSLDGEDYMAWNCWQNQQGTAPLSLTICQELNSDNHVNLEADPSCLGLEMRQNPDLLTVAMSRGPH